MIEYNFQNLATYLYQTHQNRYDLKRVSTGRLHIKDGLNFLNLQCEKVLYATGAYLAWVL